MSLKEKRYSATFEVDYADYMNALQKGVWVNEARLNAKRKFTYEKVFYALSRKKAVDKCCQWYWKELKGAWGQAHAILTVSDHCGEVRYGDDFSCADKTNRYLDEDTIVRLLEESNGELARVESTGERHHPTNSVKRTKRRRTSLRQVADNVYQHPNTKVMYYARTTVPQKTKDGKVLRKRKRENVKLASKELGKALKEIERRFGNT